MIARHIGRADGQKLASEPSADDTERDVDEAVDDKQPHGGEMPE